jgi:class 3 adenylate cyclase
MSNIDEPGIKRRISAILFADIANYTRLMGEDEVGTWRAAKPVIRNMNEMARQHQGRVLQVRGDGLFLLFDSAVDAVRFGMALQLSAPRSRINVPARSCALCLATSSAAMYRSSA